jgi:hypothetical protein
VPAPSAPSIATAIRVAVVKSAVLRIQHQLALRHPGRRGALDERAAGDAGDGDVVLALAAGARLDQEAADRELALGQRPGPLVGALERGPHQHAAGQALGRAERRHHHVDRLPGAGERRQLGGDRDDRDVLGAQLLGADLDVEAAEHLGHRAAHDRRAGVVAGAGQAGHQADADQLVLAHTLDGRQVLDALGARRRAGRHGADAQRQREPPPRDHHGHTRASRRLPQPRRC